MRKPLNALLMIRVEEQRLAKRDLIQALKSAGIRPASYSHAQLMAEARKRSWTYAHIAARHIFRFALEEAFRKVQLAERKAKPQSADTSAFRNSAAQKEPA
jgi:hypothetical protein